MAVSCVSVLLHIIALVLKLSGSASNAGANLVHAEHMSPVSPEDTDTRSFLYRFCHLHCLHLPGILHVIGYNCLLQLLILACAHFSYLWKWQFGSF